MKSWLCTRPGCRRCSRAERFQQHCSCAPNTYVGPGMGVQGYATAWRCGPDACAGAACCGWRVVGGEQWESSMKKFKFGTRGRTQRPKLWEAINKHPYRRIPFGYKFGVSIWNNSHRHTPLPSICTCLEKLRECSDGRTKDSGSSSKGRQAGWC